MLKLFIALILILLSITTGIIVVLIKNRDKINNKINFKRKIMTLLITSFILVVFLIISSISAYMVTYYNYIKIVTAINSAIGIMDKEDEIKDSNNSSIEIDYIEKDNRGKFGQYPKDDNLRLRQEMMEICDNVGEAYGIDGKLILAIAMAEAHGAITSKPAVETINGKIGSLYTNLSYDYTVGTGGKSFFKSNGNEGKFKDKQGNIINSNYKVGTVDTSVGGAIGLFQFEAKFTPGNFVTVYTEQNGKVVPKTGIPIMSLWDNELGFMRPNPLYFPDQVINTANKISHHMNSHKKYLNNIQGVIPNNIANEILFIYAADAYRGDLTGSGKNGKLLHDSMGSLFADIYFKYSKQSPNIKGLGDFSKEKYNKTAIRQLLLGQQYNTYDFTGKLNGSLNISGVNFDKTFTEEFSNTQPHNINYFDNLEAVKNNGANLNKIGLSHGFEGLNAVEYYWNIWTKQIESAEKIDTEGEDIYVSEGVFMHPTPGYRNVTSPFGLRVHPITKLPNSFHNGVDFGAPMSTPILASKSGKIIKAGWDGANGNTIYIQHSNDEVTVYGHMSVFKVKNGEEVKAGQVIGLVGNTGLSSGPHLHFEIIIKGKRIDPMTLIEK